MARAKAKLELTLFPFLSVLAGMIAVMMLFMMITLGTRVIGDEEQGQRPSAAVQKVKLEYLDEADASDAAGIDAERYEKLHQEIAQLSGVLAERIAQHRELALAVEQLEGLIEVKKNEIAIAPSTQTRPGKVLGEATLVDVVPIVGANVIRKKAHYVEVDARGYYLYPGRVFHPKAEKKPGAPEQPIRIGKPWVTIDPGLEKFLSSINVNRKKEFIVFLVHPSGVTPFKNLLHGYIDEVFPFKNNRDDEYDVGWEPFPKGWKYVPDSK